MNENPSNPTQAKTSAEHSRLKKTTRQVNNHFAASHPNALLFSSPFPFLNPTTRYHPFTLKPASPPQQEEEEETEGKQKQNVPSASKQTIQKKYTDGAIITKDVYHVWRSRDNRKGRHAAVVVRGGEGILTPRKTNTLGETWKGIVKMVVRWPVWDVSFDVAVVFTFGEFGCLLVCKWGGFPLWCLNLVFADFFTLI